MATDSVKYRSELAEKVRAAREAKGMGLRELARLAEVSPSYLSEIEAGENVPSVDKMQRIAKALGMPLPRLIPAA